MFEKLELTRMAQGLAAHSGARLALIAENVANADTPGFRAKDLPTFREVFQRSLSSRSGDLGRSRFGIDDVRPIDIGGAMSPNGNNVSLDQMMLRSVDVRQNHEMALAVYRSTSSILRASLGRQG